MKRLGSLTSETQSRRWSGRPKAPASPAGDVLRSSATHILANLWLLGHSRVVKDRCDRPQRGRLITRTELDAAEPRKVRRPAPVEVSWSRRPSRGCDGVVVTSHTLERWVG